ncbi:MAG: fumarylacetoacetate hydrolase family protein [Candidatus Sericytochromatia bacterium]|nr:fumarylacetoacetate hydrolase family protein [Candidatus Sericytochromatia bacterium]
MRLVTIELQTVLGRHVRLGALWRDGVLDLNFACAWHLQGAGEPAWRSLANLLCPPDLRAFLEVGERAWSLVRESLHRLDAFEVLPDGPDGSRLLHPLGEVRLLAPLPNPQSLRDFYAFEEHVRTGFSKRGEPIPPAWYELPVYYKGNHRTIIGPEAPLPWPRYTRQLDFELELVAVIGREGRNIGVSEAPQYIAGYTLMNDVSARDIQRKEMACRLGPAKGKDFATVLGPALVTPDELPQLDDLPAWIRVNGELWSESNAGNPYWNFAQMIAHVSMDETLYPGDVIASGTVGRGCGLELDRWIAPGDVVELEVAGLGVLRNPVGQPVTAPPPPLRPSVEAEAPALNGMT